MKGITEHMQDYNQSLLALLGRHKIKLCLLVLFALYGYLGIIPYMEKVQKDLELKKEHGNRFLSEDDLKDRKNIFDVILDVRTPEEYEKGHVKNSININEKDIAKNKKGLKRKDTILVYCKTGNRASLARNQLIEVHHFNPKNIYITNEPYDVIQTSFSSVTDADADADEEEVSV